MDFELLFLPFLPFALLLLTVSLSRRTFLREADLRLWQSGAYRRTLPDFLQALYLRHIPSAWPAREDKFSSACFMLRVHRLLPTVPRAVRRQFIRYHIQLFAIVGRIGPLLQDAMLGELQRIATRHLAADGAALDFDPLRAGLLRIHEIRDNFQQRLDTLDRNLQQQIRQTQMFRQLRQIHAIFQEHGYSLLPAFDALRRWEEMSDAELASEVTRIVNARPHRGQLPAVI